MELAPQLLDVVPAAVWLALAIMFGGAFIHVVNKSINRFVNRVDKGFEDCNKAIQVLAQNGAVHEEKISQHDEEIDDLKERVYTVKQQRR
jgi:hypothetical protein